MTAEATTAITAPNRVARLLVVIRDQPFFFQNIQLRRGAAAAISLLECFPPHHWPAGTLRRTISTWLPHPDQVVLLQTRHCTARHIADFPSFQA